MRLLVLPALAVLLTAASLPVAVVDGRDPLRDAIVAAAGAQSPATVSFDRVTRLVRTGGGSTTRQVRVERWDGARWTLVSIDDQPPSSAERARAARSASVAGYHQLARIVAAATERGGDSDGRTVLVVPVLPAGSVIADAKDISAHLQAEAVLGLRAGMPWVAQLRVLNRESFRLNMLIKVTEFEQVNDYKLDAQGQPRLVAQQNDSQGSMFGFSGGEKSEVVYAYR
ncbi:hypothetical protein GCM10007973_10680 [Polymorphobacter multimanifer]|uniref:hypothetical protein n=1 Tax=Polymorphobacter multimanifer TaxID=1070431 RepID=UPI00166E0384|nr:hypothetical protein [Polymorphobacter multimanifer]GGI75611.1 hypothetical protein GCM10007973_10680 [Polymorphobacter multimanifer]